MEPEFIIEGPQPDHDISYRFIEKNDDLQYIEKGITLADFRDNMNKRNLELEFRLIRRLTENQLFTQQLREYNPEFNKLDRYHTILPFKHSLVQLPLLTPDGNDAQCYINASYVSTSKKGENKAFIATQGPTESSKGHFWRMIWYNNINLIIMLCKLKESGRNQSECYWPKNQETANFDNMTVSVVEEENISEFFLRRKFKLQPKPNEEDGSQPEARYVNHYHWTGWPDHGVPQEEEYESIEKLLSIMAEERKNNPSSPICIHCSAGVGRSGTLITLYCIVQILKECANNLDDVKLSIFGTVRRLREQRWGMVNTADQYTFIYKYVADKIDSIMKEAQANKQKDGE